MQAEDSQSSLAAPDLLDTVQSAAPEPAFILDGEVYGLPAREDILDDRVIVDAVVDTCKGMLAQAIMSFGTKDEDEVQAAASSLMSLGLGLRSLFPKVPPRFMPVVVRRCGEYMGKGPALIH